MREGHLGMHARVGDRQDMEYQDVCIHLCRFAGQSPSLDACA